MIKQRTRLPYSSERARLLTPPRTVVFSLEHAREALELMLSRDKAGKPVVLPDMPD